MSIKTRNVVMYIVVGLLFVAAGVGVVYGVLSHNEPGLAEGVPEWPRDDIPLTVEASAYAMPLGSSKRGSVDYAIESINSRLGFDALAWADGEPADIVIVIGVPQDVSEGAPDVGFAPDGALFNAGEFSAIRHTGGVAEQCEFRTSNVPQQTLWMVVYHALGHCFGLAHDDYPMSIMFDTQRPTRDGQFPPWFSDDDRALLREMYAPR